MAEEWIRLWLENIDIVERSRLPKRRAPTIRTTPRVGDVFWCRFHDEDHIELPEMWKTRPCVVVSRRNSLRGKVTILPFSTSSSNEGGEAAIRISNNLRNQIGGRQSWILCDHPCTVATSRLSQVRGGVAKLSGPELHAVLEAMRQALAAPLSGAT